MWEYIEPITPDELYHHGIQGQKWGVRRFQNEDGSYTEAGLKRYGSLQKKIAKQEAKIATHERRKDRLLEKNGRHIAKADMQAARIRGRKSSILVSKKKARELEEKAQMKEAKVAKAKGKLESEQLQIEKAKALINKYNRKIDKMTMGSDIDIGKSYADHLMESKQLQKDFKHLSKSVENAAKAGKKLSESVTTTSVGNGTVQTYDTKKLAKAKEAESKVDNMVSDLKKTYKNVSVSNAEYDEKTNKSYVDVVIDGKKKRIYT